MRAISRVIKSKLLIPIVFDYTLIRPIAKVTHLSHLFFHSRDFIFGLHRPNSASRYPIYISINHMTKYHNGHIPSNSTKTSTPNFQTLFTIPLIICGKLNKIRRKQLDIFLIHISRRSSSSETSSKIDRRTSRANIRRFVLR